MSKTTCSVIIPAYQAQATIRACLDSVYSQSVPDEFEVIVVDSSLDFTPHIVLSGFPQARLFHLPQRTDPAQARNLGACQARGDALVFIDSDCSAAPGWLAGLLGWLRRGYAAAGGSILNGNPDSLVSWAGYLCEFREFLPTGPSREVKNLTLGNAAYKKEAFWAAGAFPTGCFPQEDQVFHHAFIQQGGRIRFDPSLAVSHTHRSEREVYLAHQRRIGQANARVVRRLGLPGATLAYHPGLVRTAFPALVGLRFTRTWLAAYQVAGSLPHQRLALAWLCLQGMWAWGQGFAEGSKASVQAQEVIHAHPSA